MSPVVIDWTRCEALAERAADGDPAAWRMLMETLWAEWLSFARSHRAMRRLGEPEEHAHEVVAKLVEKLGRGDGHGLRLYRSWHDRHADKTFEDWMHIVVANTVRDHVREQLGEAKAPRVSEDPSVKRLLNEFAQSPLLERLGVRPPIPAAQTARQILDFARKHLPPDQHRALMRWIEGATFEEIEQQLGLSGRDAGRKLVRAAVATLRRHFAAA